MPTGLQKDDVLNYICDMLAYCSSQDEFDEAIRLAHIYLEMFDDKAGFDSIMIFSRFVIIDIDD